MTYEHTNSHEKEIIENTRIGIIGGGQLGLMLSEAAQKMGFAPVTVLDPTPHCPASVVAHQIVGNLKDHTALRQLAEVSDVLTYEIEHINTEALSELQRAGIKIHPAPELLAIIQNKYAQKEFLSKHNIPVAPYMPIDSSADLEQAIQRWGYNLVLKARKDAYDGRGNARINGPEDIQPALARLGDRELYVEKRLDLEKELGIMIARNEREEVSAFPVVEMIHVRDICQTVLAPAPIAPDLQRKATEIAVEMIQQLQGVGIFGVEMFLDTEGKIWLNEVAPRPHNLGHYTIEACQTSQFEQHLRAITNLPLTPTNLLYPAAVMENILGERNGPAEVHWSHYYDHEHVFPHIYGKRETKFDRKMGHITVVGTDPDSVQKQAKEARAALSI